jgi:hypothetical protein
MDAFISEAVEIHVHKYLDQDLENRKKGIGVYEIQRGLDKLRKAQKDES